jgi:glucokinase
MAQALRLALPLPSVTLIPIASGVCQRGVFRMRRHSQPNGRSARSAADITKCALCGDCQVAHEALAKFCAFLGSFAGNVALTFGARGGVYIAGGISPPIVDFMAIGISQSL